MSSLKPPNKIGRRQHDMLIDLGYEALGMQRGGHYKYEHPHHPSVFVSGTAYDRTGWQAFVSQMRRLHPDHFKVEKSSRPKPSAVPVTKQRAKQRAKVTAIVNQAVKDNPPLKAVPSTASISYTGCPDCGYRWQSDIDPSNRPCPKCPGSIVIAKAA